MDASTIAAAACRGRVPGIHAVLVAALTVVAGEAVLTQDQPALLRIRSHSARITSAIAEGSARSATFRRLVETIDAGDVLVYVDEGECRQSVAACLLMSVTIAGPFRVLQIRVNLRRTPGCTLVESIGHEFQHVVEVLSEPRVRTGSQLYHFFERIGDNGRGMFETVEAVNVGLDIAREACRGR
jgi:hypothetical protein